MQAVVGSGVDVGCAAGIIHSGTDVCMGGFTASVVAAGVLPAERAGPSTIRPHVITRMIRTNLRFLTVLDPR